MSPSSGSNPGDPSPNEPEVAKEPSAREALRDGFTLAARNAGIASVTPGEVPTGAALLAAVGGIRGIIEAVVPGLGFLVVYTLTGEVLPSVVAPLVLAIIFVGARALTRTTISPALAGLFGIGISATFALMSGRAEDNFLPGLIINLVSVLVLLGSLAVRWPLIGVIVGFITGEPSEWRDDRAKRRVLTVATWLWAGFFSLRLAVQGPLYLSGQTEVLAGAKLVMGVPLYAAMLWVTWLLVRAVYARHAAAQVSAKPSD